MPKGFGGGFRGGFGRGGFGMRRGGFPLFGMGMGFGMAVGLVSKSRAFLEVARADDFTDGRPALV